MKRPSPATAIIGMAIALALATACVPAQNNSISKALTTGGVVNAPPSSNISTNSNPTVNLTINQSILTNHAPAFISAAGVYTVYLERGLQLLAPTLPSGVDPDGDFLRYSLEVPPQFGILSDCLGLGVDLLGGGVAVAPVGGVSNQNALTSLSCQYRPFSGVAAGTDTFTYKMDDGRLGVVYKTVSVQLITLPEITAPPSSFSVTVLENRGSQSIDLASPLVALSLDSSQTYRYFLKTPPITGSLSGCLGILGSSFVLNNCRYTPKTDVSGLAVDQFTVGIRSSTGKETTFTVLVNITSTNLGPSGPSPSIVNILNNHGAQLLTINPAVGTAGTVSSQLFYNATGTINSGVLTTSQGGKLVGCLSLAGSSSLPDFSCSYTPQTNFLGTDSFSYQIFDNEGKSTTVQVFMNVYRNLPTLASPFGSTVFAQQNISTSFNLVFGDANLVSTPSYPTDLASAYVLDATPTPGVGVVLANKGIITNCLGVGTPIATQLTIDGNCDYTPFQNFSGTENFTVRVTEAGGDYADLPISISVDPINQPPVLGTSVVVTARENGGLQLFTLAAATDPDSSSIVYYATPIPTAYGLVSSCLNINSSGVATSTPSSDLVCAYVPPPNFFGTPVHLNVVAQDDASPALTSNNSDVLINVLTSNRSPYFGVISNFLTVGQNSGINSTVLSSAIDPDGDAIHYTITTNPTLGSTLNCPTPVATSTGLDCQYQPTTNLKGSDFFQITATDPEGLTAKLGVFVNITTAFVVPTCIAHGTPEAFTINQNTRSSVALAPTPNLLGGADSNSNPQTYSLAISPTHGTLSGCLNLGGSSASNDLTCNYLLNTSSIPNLSLASNVNFDTFSYYVDNGQGKALCQATITITSVNQPPTIGSSYTASTSSLSSAIPVATAYYTTSGTDLYIDNILIDEGGGTWEDGQALSYTIASSNVAVVPNVNSVPGNSPGFFLSYGASRATATPLASSAIGDNTFTNTDASTDKYLFLRIIPQSILTGTPRSTTVSLQITDNAATPLRSTPIAFGVIVDPANHIAPNHNGWAKVKAQGAAIRRGVLDSDNDEYYPETNHDDTVVSFDWNSVTQTLATPITNYLPIGFNVYRNSNGGADTDFNYGLPLNPTPISSGNSYTDSSLSTDPLSINRTTQARVFFYQIRPVYQISTSIGTKIKEVAFQQVSGDKTLRVVVPPQNKFLVHRWMANRAVCEQLGFVDNDGSNNIDHDNNYRCPYYGPGNTLSGGQGYYDLGYDLIVDRFEVGCPFNRQGCVFGLTGSASDCVLSDPNFYQSSSVVIYDRQLIQGGASAHNAGTIYYDRTDGKCYASTGVGTIGTTSAEWLSAATLYATPTASYTPYLESGSPGNYPDLPPLEGLTQKSAYAYCSNQTGLRINAVLGDSYLSPTPYLSYSNLPGRLMSKREFMVASLEDVSLSAIDIGNLQGGGMGSDVGNASLTACNTNFSFGLESFFTILGAGDSGLAQYQTLPGISNVPLSPRSLVTGSILTERCLSRFGGQDMVGNLWEWTSDRFQCTSTTLCSAVSSLNQPALRLDSTNDDLLVKGTPALPPHPNAYNLDSAGNGNLGICDTDGDGTCGSSGDFYILAATPTPFFNQIFLPMGLPVSAEFATTGHSTLKLASAFLEVAGTSIATTKFTNDQAMTFGYLVATPTSQVGGVVVGGGYTSGSGTASGGNAAGRYAWQVLMGDSLLSTPIPNSGYPLNNKGVGFRCVTPISYP